MKELPVAIYARVSTDDKDQNPETQLLPLREYCRLKGWTVYREYIDYASARDLRGRKEWRDMVKDAQKRKVSRFLIFRLNRAFRSVKDMYDELSKMDDCEMVSYHESIDTSTATGRLLRNILAALAEFEVDQIRENVRAGLERAKAEGKTLGRPKGSTDKKPRKKRGYYLRKYPGS
ncbi:MAG: recombinase family protein [Planctomycetes bacterium]|nr:recombinase family protein [Planctomycetota bacterium]